MIDEFIKKVYIKVKELFTETENPLYDDFYKDEESGYKVFKKHFLGDETLKWLYKEENQTYDNSDFVARSIVYKINRYYGMSGQKAKQNEKDS